MDLELGLSRGGEWISLESEAVWCKRIAIVPLGLSSAFR